MRERQIAVIGGGIAGVTAAAALARSARVALFERAGEIGGKIRRVALDDGTRHTEVDFGPTVFTMKWAFEEAFAEAGADFDACVRTTPVDVLARHVWPDGAQLDLYADIDRAAAAIAAFAGPADAAAYRRFCLEAQGIFETLREPFLRADAPDFLRLMVGSDPRALLRLQPYGSLWSALCKRFADRRLAQLFGRYATYAGSSPFEAPATLMLIAHVEQAGVWRVDGGLRSVARSLARLAAEAGADIRCDAPVARLEPVAGGVEVTGADGTAERFDAAIVAADAGAVAAGLLGPAAAEAVPWPRDAVRSPSGIARAMLARSEGVDLSLHTVFFGASSRAEFDAVFHRGTVPRDPTVYIYAPDRAGDGSGRGPPPGTPERLFVLINAPADGDRRTPSEEETDSWRTRTFERLAASGLTLAPTAERAAGPADFEAAFPGTGGALYGTAQHGWRAAFKRPGARSRTPGIYLAGASAHPGPGAPMAALSGLAAARAVLKDFASTRPSRRAATPGGTPTR